MKQGDSCRHCFTHLTGMWTGQEDLYCPVDQSLQCAPEHANLLALPAVMHGVSTTCLGCQFAPVQMVHLAWPVVHLGSCTDSVTAGTSSGSIGII